MSKFINIKLISFLSLSVILFHQMQLSSQPSLVWLSQYNGPINSFDQANNVCIDDSGNVYVTGESNGGSGLNYDYATVKYNSAGAEQWTARYNGPGDGDDKSFAVCADKNGNVYVTGSSKGIGNNNMDIATIKYDNSGVEQWVVRYYYSATSNDIAYGMCIDTSGNIYVAGKNGPLRVIKYNSSGTQVWIASYDGPSTGGNNPEVIINDRFGNVLVAGSSDSDFLTLKYNSDGVQQWVTTYNGPSNQSDYIRAMKTDFNGNVIVTGVSYSSSPDWMTIKYDPNGNEIWSVRNQRSGETYDFARDVYIDNTGNVYVTGSQSDVIKLGSYMKTYKYSSSNGAVMWSKSFDTFYSEYGANIVGDGLSNVIVLYAGVNYNNFRVFKYSSSGQLIWSENLTGIESFSSVISDDKGNFFVTGGAEANFVTMKYNEIITGIYSIGNEFPYAFLLDQNFPNPFNPKTIINYQLSMFNYASLKVYDVLGNEAAALVNEKQSAGSYSVEFDGSGFASGVYFYKLEAGEFTETKRMVLLK